MVGTSYVLLCSIVKTIYSLWVLAAVDPRARSPGPTETTSAGFFWFSPVSIFILDLSSLSSVSVTSLFLFFFFIPFTSGCSAAGDVWHLTFQAVVFYFTTNTGRGMTISVSFSRKTLIIIGELRDGLEPAVGSLVDQRLGRMECLWLFFPLLESHSVHFAVSHFYLSSQLPCLTESNAIHDFFNHWVCAMFPWLYLTSHMVGQPRMRELRNQLSLTSIQYGICLFPMSTYEIRR